ncbi:MAG: ABC transporter ATP-binding protein/permease [Oscillospiraceae bacterium]|nr:ABC transporter ATP-binding protein/permease [Oscillospiraceae bacterium]
MLELNNIVRRYKTGDTTISALDGISVKFRRNEFVSVLGPSGCGKTTTLNIIGGLDRYDEGDLIINGRSTKDYKERDWDTYRNHSVGFVFQSYNLIPHQTVLSNVELALTLSGVSRAERRRRAKEALEKVGLGDQLYKKPGQMSGGQMQRVAIARALVNDPEILLADEPTGALDTETSIQVMEILKEISSDRLIIMVTHNPELAEKYSSRIIRLLDGKITGDTAPYDGSDENEIKDDGKKAKKPTMSFGTALSLSANNLMTKKGRTLLTSFAGSIGIIGIALVLSISNGIQEYIDRVQEDTLSSYPLSIQAQTVDMSAIMKNMSGERDKEADHPLDKVYTNSIMTELTNTMIEQVKSNDLEKFMKFLNDENNGLGDAISTIQYTYDIPLNIYKADTSEGAVQVNPSVLFDKLYGNSAQMASLSMMSGSSMATMSNMSGLDRWSEMIDNEALLHSQYDIIAGKWPESFDEAVLVVSENNELTDYTLFSLDILDQESLDGLMEASQNGEPFEIETRTYTYDELLALEYSLVLPTDYYRYNEDTGGWDDMREDEEYMKDIVDKAQKIKIVGILRPNPDAVSTAIGGAIGYTSDLVEYVINGVNDSEIVKKQLAEPDIDVFTGLEFPKEGEKGEEKEKKEYTMDDINAYIEKLPEEEKGKAKLGLMMMSEEQAIQMFSAAISAMTTDATYEENLEKLCVNSLEKPYTINIYAATFEAKDRINDAIEAYNERATAEGREADVINYTDFVGLIMSSVTTIINAISYVLIAFVSISLIVSSIMIGIITYISVLERTKEIGILRSIGASKKDISRVFNAETVIIGFSSGALGILVTVLMNIPINAIIKSLTDISDLSVLPPVAGAILVAISVVLTLIAGIIPSRMAARKDPVEALRSE